MNHAVLEFFLTVGRLKRLPRTGWLDRGLAPGETESVADHSFRVALLAWVMAAEEPALDSDRILKLALVHDLAEAITGDQTPYEQAQLATSGQERTAFLNQRHLTTPERAAAKRAAESAAFHELTEALPDAIRVEFRSLWKELEERVTAESKFVKESDRIETYLQSVEYLRDHPDLPMNSFRLEVEESITSSSLVELRDAIEDSR